MLERFPLRFKARTQGILYEVIAMSEAGGSWHERGVHAEQRGRLRPAIAASLLTGFRTHRADQEQKTWLRSVAARTRKALERVLAQGLD